MGLKMNSIIQSISNKLNHAMNPPVEEIGPFQYEPGTLSKKFEAPTLENPFNADQLAEFVERHTSVPALKEREAIAERLENSADDMNSEYTQAKSDYFTLIDQDVVYAQGLLADYEADKLDGAAYEDDHYEL